MNRFPSCFLLLTLAVISTSSLGAEEDAPRTLDDFEMHQYTSSRGFDPLSVLRLDNNGEIVVACREPATREDLAATGLDVLDSQLILLRVMRFLAFEDGRCRTLVPLLDRETTARLRNAVSARVPELVTTLRPLTTELASALSAMGSDGHAWIILFSYVLDGMAWEFFEEFGEVRPRRVTSSSPHWAGEIWGVRPARPYTLSTHSIVSGDVRLKVGRSSASGVAVEELLSDWRSLRDLLRDYAGEEAAEESSSPLPVERLRDFALIDGDGDLAVPVLVEKPGRPVFEAAQRITEALTDEILAGSWLTDLQQDLGTRDREQTLIIAYSELVSELMDAFGEEGFTAPRALSDPQASKSEVSELVFVVDRRREPAPGRIDEEVTDEE